MYRILLFLSLWLCVLSAPIDKKQSLGVNDQVAPSLSELLKYVQIATSEPIDLPVEEVRQMLREDVPCILDALLPRQFFVGSQENTFRNVIKQNIVLSRNGRRITTF
ncbi:uncharacterized protein BX664DRAFT_317719 [Halteromyces radiatus]|uniref:uncharacterized protein n=1 Tax=Halteromyces radiatus TaxID=101107 RepID=UPI002220409F|nr:uncharacterized protein BX664DRAFT_317719 [Halteromyces radiatus]KAI8079819.1 hypothetical protein BX664DRAFT_317719 [Halteromyces radiatus]